MTGGHGTGLRGPLHLIEEDLNEEWIAETIEDVERRLAAEVAMDEASQGIRPEPSVTRTVTKG